MAALGARLRDVTAFVWSEAGLVLTAALALAAGLGWLLSEMLVAMLQQVFDPPPDTLAVPWRYLLELAAAALIGTATATAIAARVRPPENVATERRGHSGPRAREAAA